MKSDTEYLRKTYSDESNDENSIIPDESRNLLENKSHVLQESESGEDYLNNDGEFDFPITQENAEMTDDEIQISNHNQRPPQEPPFPILPKDSPQSSMKEKVNENVNERRNVVECRNQLTMRRDNYVYFLSTDGTPRDNGSKSLERRNELQFKNVILGEAKEIQRENFYHIALPIESESDKGLSGILYNIKNVIQSLHDLAKQLELRSISISKTSHIKHIYWQEILTIIKNTLSNDSIKNIIQLKPYNRIRQKYFCENMKLHIQKYIQVCLQCQHKQLVRVKTKNTMVFTDTLGVAF